MFFGESFDKVPDEQDIDPYSYNDAIKDKDTEFWQKAMVSKMESMYSNQIWDLVELPEGIKSIGCKGIYKKKRGVYDKVEIFKARLVAKGLTQKKNWLWGKFFASGYAKVYSDSLIHAAHFDYKIW